MQKKIKIIVDNSNRVAKIKIKEMQICTSEY